MIKGGSYGKLLKQSFIILLISCFTLLGSSFVSAVDCDGIDVGGGRAFGIGLGEYGLYNSGNNDCGLNIEFNGSIDGNFNFNDNVFRYDAIYGDTYFWRTSEGLRYQFNRYNSTTVYNGLINGFFACSEVPAFGSNYYLKNVNSCTYHEGFDSLSDYLQNPTSWGYLTKLTTSNSNMAICVYANNNYICIDRSNAINTSTTLISYDTASSEAIRNPFSNNNTSSIVPPSMSGSGNIISPILTGDYLVNKCTYQEIIDYIENAGVSKYLCYGGLDNFDLYDSSITYNPLPGSGKTIQQILAYSNSWDTPKEWFDFRNGLRGGYNEMWSSYPAVYKTWFDLYYQYGGSTFNFNDILEYCNILQLDIDYSNTYYNGSYFNNTCVNGVKNPINNGLDSDKNVGVNRDGVGGKTGYTTYSDGTMFIQDYFNTLKSKFPTKYDLGYGFLPSYIIFFLLALVFFRFLAH